MRRSDHAPLSRHATDRVDWTGEVAIRLLQYSLIAALLAISLAIGGYSLLLAFGRRPPATISPISIEPFAEMPAPERLPRHPSFVPASAERPRSILAMELAPLVVEVRDLPAEFTEGAGVALFQPELQAMWSWLPLTNARRVDGSLSLSSRAPRTPLRVVIAAGEESARQGYWLSVEGAGDRDHDEPIVLRAPVQEVRVRAVTDPAGHQQLLRLRRVGDDEWRPQAAFRNGSRATTEQGHLDLVLGPGTYRLAPWTGQGWSPVPIHVPGPAEITAVFRR